MDVFIGYDRTEPFHFDGGGDRMECPYCSWYLDASRPKMPDLREWRLGEPIRIEWTRIDLIAEEHLKDAHADEPEVQRALEIERRRTPATAGGEKPAVMCPTCGATWGRIATYQCDGPREKPHPRVRTVPYVG